MPETNPGMYVHTISEAGRLLPSSSRWNSVEIDYNMFPSSKTSHDDHTPSKYSQSYSFKLSISDITVFKRFIYISGSVVILIMGILLLLLFLLRHKHLHERSSGNFTIPVQHVLTFFDAQKSGYLPTSNSVKFRGNSGLLDGTSIKDIKADLIGGFYDSGNNIKFTFPTAYTITLLSWSVIEYHEKYTDIGEIDHIKDIIKWGSDYLLKVFIPPNSTAHSTILYSKVGSTNNSATVDTDINCWARPEDMKYDRQVSFCKETASDLAGEIIAALSAASLVFKEEKDYSIKLIKAAEQLYGVTTRDTDTQGTYMTDDACDGGASQFYNSSGYMDELVWGGTWLFFTTGNTTYLQYATDNFESAVNAQIDSDKHVFDWNNKIAANAMLLTRLQYFRDPGYPYQVALRLSTNVTNLLICSYLSQPKSNITSGGLFLLRPGHSAPLQYAATASFLIKLYKDYLDSQAIPRMQCGPSSIALDKLQSISTSQVEYILGKNPKKMSYMVGYGDNYPKKVHHRAASIPWDNEPRTCEQGKRWLYSEDSNPNVLVGAMVAGPDEDDNFIDAREQPQFTEPTISGNAGLIAALIALHELPSDSSSSTGGLDQMAMFANI